VENLRYSRYEAWHRALSAILIISVRRKMMLVDGNLQKNVRKQYAYGSTSTCGGEWLLGRLLTYAYIIV
jgi:hypothetical protein